MSDRKEFWRIYNNEIHVAGEVDKLGFSEKSPRYIHDNYLRRGEFDILRTAFGFGDWAILSAMPRLLKQKYPNCQVCIPSRLLLAFLFRKYEGNWQWQYPWRNVKDVFFNNLYIDGYMNDIRNEVYHDHFRIYDEDNPKIPLIEQMLKFWKFKNSEIRDSQPELYFNYKEKQIGDEIMEKYTDGEYGCLLTSGKYDYNDDSNEKIIKILEEYSNIPWFYHTSKPLNETPFDFINSVLDLRYVQFRTQLYIRTRAVVNVGNQCGVLDALPRYSRTYSVARDVGSNYVRGMIYI